MNKKEALLLLKLVAEAIEEMHRVWGLSIQSLEDKTDQK